MRSIKVRIINQKTLSLEEDAFKGDIIDLNSAISIDTSFIQRLIENEKNSYLEKRLNEQHDNLTKLHKEELEKIKLEISNKKDLENKKEFEKYQDIINSLNEEKIKLEAESNNEKEKINLEFNLERSKIEAKNNEEIQKVKNDLNNYKKLYEKNLEIEKNKVIKEYNDELNKLDKEILDYKNKINQIELENKNKILELTNLLGSKHNEEIEKIKKELNDTQVKYDQLSLTKSFQNIKKLGEELEKRCTQEYENAAISGFLNCTWQKDNEVVKENGEIKGSKADFIFKVYNDLPSNCTSPISSVCLEMKNESNVSTNKKKNSDHYKKLDDDRKKKGCEYALLVSELEWDTANDSPIKKVHEYEKMYVIRPQYMITFLSMIYTLSIKYGEIINTKNKEILNLKESQEIVNEFEKLKSTYLDKPLTALENEIETINNNNSKIIEFAEKNKITINNIINSTIDNIKIKIERFDIKKLTKHRNALDD